MPLSQLCFTQILLVQINAPCAERIEQSAIMAQRSASDFDNISGSPKITRHCSGAVAVRVVADAG